MFAWGLSGASAGLLKMVYSNIGTKGMAVFNFVWGYLFGWIMNVWFWAAFVYPLTWQSFAATYVASFWFDTIHAIGNVVFCFIFGASFTKVLRRFRKRLEIKMLN